MVKETTRINLTMNQITTMELVCEYCLDIIKSSNGSPGDFCHECTYKRIMNPIRIPELPFKLKERVQNKKYMFNGKVVICKGGVCSDSQCIEPSNNCIHELPKKNCPDCNI